MAYKSRREIMIMRIPKKLLIGGHTIKVIIKEMEDCGQFRRDLNQIWLNKGIAKSQREATLFHEIFHQINNELSEAMVDALAEQTYQVLSQNKLLK